MNKHILIIIVILAGLFFNSCKNKSSKNIKIEVSKEIKTEKEESIPIEEKEALVSDFVKQSVDDELADKINSYITTKFLTEGDLELIPEGQRQFQFYQIDLNNDGENEVFVNLMTSYFCGSGGCTILLLNNQLKPITKFTAIRTPLFAEQTLKNGWRILLTKSEGEFKEMIYNNGTYPSNPSVIEKAPYDAPSGHAEIMFDINFSKPKTYNF